MTATGEQAAGARRYRGDGARRIHGGGVDMAQRCPSCGGEVFLGETRCPACKAPIAGAAEAARQAGVDLAPGPTDPRRASGGPPPEGLSLIVRKGVADQEARRPHEPPSRLTFGTDGGTGVDDLAELTRPTRDGQGNVVWDWRHALVGGVVVAVVVGILAFVAYGWVTSSKVGVDGFRPSTTTTLRR